MINNAKNLWKEKKSLDWPVFYQNSVFYASRLFPVESFFSHVFSSHFCHPDRVLLNVLKSNIYLASLEWISSEIETHWLIVFVAKKRSS